MNLIIPIIAAVAGIIGILVNAFIIEHGRDDWKDVIRIALLLGLVIGVSIGILNYFIMVKVIGINLIIAFTFFFTISFWAGYALYNSKKMAPGIIVALVLVFLVVSPNLITTQLYEVTDIPLAEGKPLEIDTTHIRQVNYEYAKWKADKVVGEMGNRVMIGELEIMLFQGRLTWICPLIHRGFFKQWEYGVTPGYIMVDAEDPTIEAVLVDDYLIDYSYEYEYFGDYMHRIIYNSYQEYDQLWAFEIDETGAPWVVITLTQPTVSYMGDVVRRVVVASPINKSMQSYVFGEQPDWIDNAFPEELAERYCEWWGSYKHGFWNTYISEKDVKIPTAKNNAYSQDGAGYYGTDVYMIVGGDNQTYWFTDFTSPASSDQSMVGYVLMNTKTGESNFYEVSALLNGDAAMEAATAKVTNFVGWYATQPIFLIIDGNETWFTPVHSGTNILQKVALVSAQDGDVTMGDTLEEILAEFTEDVVLPTSTLMNLTGNVTTIYSYVSNGETEWYLDINGTVFYAGPDLQPFLIEVGDNITVEYQETEGRNVMVSWE
ncbi:MAG: magnesium transporter [Thermoplasmata archaeon]|nr:magnesium transporter [Thermoplasmata archaeon]